MRRCILCSEETEGSIGSAGIKWSCICQKCKDEEDKIAEQRIICQAKIFDKIESLVMERI